MTNPQFGDTVIDKQNGDIGRVVELDTQGRTHRVIYRNGRDTWHDANELFKV